MEKILNNLFKNNKISVNSQKNTIFSLFFDILIKNNKKFNLTRIIEKEEVAKKTLLRFGYVRKIYTKKLQSN